MKFRLPRFLIFACAALLAPSLAFAAFDDLTITTDAVISVGGYTLNVSGSSAVIQSIVANTDSFSVTLASGSSFEISSPTLQQLSSDVTSDVTDNTCTGSASSISLAYTGGTTVTNVITPSATICTDPAPSSGGPTNGGGGGGAIYGSGPFAPGYQVGTTTPVASSTSGIVSTNLSAQPAATTRFALARLTSTLTRGMKTAQVKVLQQMLNSDPTTQLVSTGLGSAGQETTLFGLLTEAAVKAFQIKYGIVSTGTAATTGFGVVGPKTRARLNTLYSSL